MYFMNCSCYSIILEYLGRLDYEQATHYDLVVEAFDFATATPPAGLPGPFITTLHLLINLTDINDNAPQFADPNDSFQLEETEELGTIVYNVAAWDVDSGLNGEFSFAISQLVPASNITYFVINEGNGSIRLDSSLDLDFVPPIQEIVLLITVTDKGTPVQMNETNLTILISQVDEFSPSFLHGDISVDISENQPISLVLFNVNATDPDFGLGGEFVFVKSGSPDNSFFTLDEDSGVVVGSIQFDRETKDSYSWMIVVETIGINPVYRSSTVNVLVTILDENDNPPMFQQAVYSFDFVETTPTNAGLDQITATDRDINLNANLRYSLYHVNSANNVFSIDELTGLITLRKDLNLESPAVLLPPEQIFNLTITAFDRSAEPKYTNATVLLQVTGVNEFSPNFSNMTGKMLPFKENISISETLFQVIATDRDFGPQGVISYSFLSGNDEGRFSIDSATGSVVLVSGLDREDKDTYDLVIIALDSDPVLSDRLNDTLPIRISVEDVNDNAPILSVTSCAVSVAENSPINSSLFSISASDADLTNSSNSDFEFFSTSTVPFSIDSVTGNVSLSGAIDYEGVTSYQLRLFARDKGSPSLTSSVLSCPIQILGINEFPPVFTSNSYSFSVAENSPVNTVFGRISATDDDGGIDGEIVYSVSGDNRFIVNANGDLLVLGFLDREIDTVPILLNVSAVDSLCGSLRFTAHSFVTVTVEDINDNSPTFIHNNQYQSISEDTGIGVSIAQFVASDRDFGSNGEVMYSISAGPFSINSSTGVVSVESALDRETRSSYELMITASDQASQNQMSSTATLFVNIEDVNDNPPVFSQLSYAEIVEELTPVNKIIFTVAASDIDLGVNSQVSYTIGSQSGDFFVIESSTGAITLKRTLSGFGVQHNLTVRATDSGAVALSSTALVIITVTPSNRYAPIFQYSDNYTVYVEENMMYLLPILTVTAEDLDQGLLGVVTYSVVGSYDVITINPTNGSLSLLAPLDREEYEDAILIQVQASDNAAVNFRRSSVTNVLIVVIDVNDNAPYFPQIQHSIQIPSDLEAGEQILAVSASDIDSDFNSDLTYSLSGDSCPFYTDILHGGIFYNGEIIQSGQTYHVVLTSMDYGTPPLSNSTSITVTVLENNRFSPLFISPPSTLTISEDLGISQSIHSFTVLDLDTGLSSDVTYSISAGNIGDVFAISSQGELSIRRALNFEQVEQYSIIIEARNPNGLFQLKSSLVPIHVVINDVNDELPTFDSSKYSFYMTSDYGSGVIIGKLNVSDDVLPQTVLNPYRILPGANADLFSVARDGTISLKANYSVTSQIGIEYGDTISTASTTVHIIVEDLNIYAPEFAAINYSYSIQEDSSLSLSVFRVEATDMDSGQNVTYEIAVNDFFAIDRYDGTVSLIQILDYEQIQSLSLTVTAKDNASIWQQKSSTQTIVILVQDVNDSPPIFSKAEYHFVVENTTVNGTVIGKVIATDRDTSSTLSYDILSNSQYFQLSSQTGDISVERGLALQGDTILVSVTDSNFSDITVVVIDVVPANIYTPMFSYQNYTILLSESTPIGSVVFASNATDFDIGSNGDITYNITDNPYFTISNTGQVFLDSSIDFDLGISLITLELIAMDQGHLNFRRSSTVSLMVNIINENDNPPKFSDSVYEVFIEEGSARDSFVFQLTAFDIDNDTLSYQVIAGNTNDAFTLVSSTGLISLNTVPYVDVNPFYNLRVEVSDTGNNVAVASIEIRIIPQNRFTPQFPSQSYAFEVTNSIGAIIGRISAADSDTENEGMVSYSIVSQTTLNSFVMNPITGSLQLAKLIDRTISDHFVIARVCDLAVITYQRCANIRINITLPNTISHLTVEPSFISRTLSLPGINRTYSIKTFLLSRNATTSSLSVEVLNCASVMTFSLRISFPYIELIYTQNEEVNILRTQLRIGVMNVSFSILELNFLPSTSTLSPKFSQNTYYINIFSNTQVGAEITEITIEPLLNSFDRIVYEIASGNDDEVFALQSNVGKLYLYKPLPTDRPIYILTLSGRVFFDSNSPVFQESTTNIYVIIHDLITTVSQPSAVIPDFNPSLSLPPNIWSLAKGINYSNNVYNIELSSFTSKSYEVQVSLGHVNLSVSSQVLANTEFYHFTPQNEVWSTQPNFKLLIYQDTSNQLPTLNGNVSIDIFSQSYSSQLADNMVSTFTIDVPGSEFDAIQGAQQSVEIPFTINQIQRSLSLVLVKVMSSTSNGSLNIPLSTNVLYPSQILALPLHANNFQSSLTTFEVKMDITGALAFNSFSPASGWSVFTRTEANSVIVYGVNDVIINPPYTMDNPIELIGHFLISPLQNNNTNSATLSTEILLLTDNIGVITGANGQVDFLHPSGALRVVTIQIEHDQTVKIISTISQRDILEVGNIIEEISSTVDIGVRVMAVSSTGEATQLETTNPNLSCTTDEESVYFISSECGRLLVGSDNSEKRVTITITYEGITDTQYVYLWRIERVEITSESNTLHPISSWLDHNCQQFFEWTKISIRGSIVNSNLETRQIDFTKPLISRIDFNDHLLSLVTHNLAYYLKPKNLTNDNTPTIVTIDIQVASISMVPLYLTISDTFSFITGVSSTLIVNINSTISDVGRNSDILYFQIHSYLTLYERIGTLKNSIVLNNVTSIDYIFSDEYLQIIPVDPHILSVVRNSFPEIHSSLIYRSTQSFILLIITNTDACGGNLLFSTSAPIEITQTNPSSLEIELSNSRISHPDSLLTSVGIPTTSSLRILGIVLQYSFEIEAFSIVYNNVILDGMSSAVTLSIDDPTQLIVPSLDNGVILSANNHSSAVGNATLEVSLNSILLFTSFIQLVNTPTLELLVISTYTGEVLPYLPKIGANTFEPFKFGARLRLEDGSTIDVTQNEDLNIQVLSSDNSPLCTHSLGDCTLSTNQVSNSITLYGSFLTLAKSSSIDLLTSPQAHSVSIIVTDKDGLPTDNFVYGSRGSEFHISFSFMISNIPGIYHVSTSNLSHFADNIIITSNHDAVHITQNKDLSLEAECTNVQLSISLFSLTSILDLSCNFLPSIGSPHLGFLQGLPLPSVSSSLYTIPLYFHFEDDASTAIDINIQFTTDEMTFSHLIKSAQFSTDNQASFGGIFLLHSSDSSSIHIGVIPNSGIETGFVRITDLVFNVVAPLTSAPNILIDEYKYYSKVAILENIDLRGDLNSDSKLDMADILILSNSIASNHLTQSADSLHRSYDITRDGKMDFQDVRRLISTHFGILPLPISYSLGYNNSLNICPFSVRIELTNSQHSTFTRFNTDTLNVYVGLILVSNTQTNTQWTSTIGSYISQASNDRFNLVLFEAFPETDSIYALNTANPLPQEFLNSHLVIFLRSSLSLPPISGLSPLQNATSSIDPFLTTGIPILMSNGEPLPLPPSLYPIFTLSDFYDTQQCYRPMEPISFLQALTYGGPPLLLLIIVLLIIISVLVVIFVIIRKKKRDIVRIRVSEEKEKLRDSHDQEGVSYRGMTYYPDPSEAYSLARTPSPYKDTYEHSAVVQTGYDVPSYHDSMQGEFKDDSLSIKHKVSSTSATHSLIQESLPGTPKK